MTAEDRAHQIRDNLRTDMQTTLGTYGITEDNLSDEVRDGIVEDAMFQVEKLLAEIEDLPRGTDQVDQVEQFDLRIQAVKVAREVVLTKGTGGGFGVGGAQGVNVDELLKVATWIMQPERILLPVKFDEQPLCTTGCR